MSNNEMAMNFFIDVQVRMLHILRERLLGLVQLFTVLNGLHHTDIFYFVGIDF